MFHSLAYLSSYFSDKVKPLIWNNPSFVNPTDLVFDAAKENIYISQRFGVVKYNLDTSELTLVAGSNASVHTDRPKGYETRDGPLFDARFGGMYCHDAIKQLISVVASTFLWIAVNLIRVVLQQLFVRQFMFERGLEVLVISHIFISFHVNQAKP